MTDFSRVTRLEKEKEIVFQLDGHATILSMVCLKRSVVISHYGKEPRYFPKSVEWGILATIVILLASSCPTLPEKQIVDFWRLIF